MRKWIVAILGLAAIGVLLLRETRSDLKAAPVDEEDTAAAATSDEPAAEATAPVAPTVATAEKPATEVPAVPSVWNDDEPAERAENAAPRTLDPTSQAYFTRVDEDVPRRIQRFAADKCYDDKRIDEKEHKMVLGVRERFLKGEVIVLDAWVIKSTFTDSKLQDCIVDAVRSARWLDRELPDGERDDELFIRFGVLRKYASNLPDPEIGEDPQAPRGIR